MPNKASDRNLLNHGGGKGDKDRSPGWRKNYDEIDFCRVGSEREDGFARRGNKLVKAYGVSKRAVFVTLFDDEPPICLSPL